ncbi:hypothetical protein Tsubulata_007232, partial [Turnera subulata]
DFLVSVLHFVNGFSCMVLGGGQFPPRPAFLHCPEAEEVVGRRRRGNNVPPPPPLGSFHGVTRHYTNLHGKLGLESVALHSEALSFAFFLASLFYYLSHHRGELPNVSFAS